jgi:hypothetical protein
VSQTSIIAAVLLLAFFVFIVVRGELPSYLGVLGIGSAAVPSGATAPASTASTIGQTAGAIGGTLSNF